tara:strand:- start:35 stop:277 length:243 start_codon:yes stop_codon:yes gene_type:complete
MIAFLKHRFTRMGVGTIAAFLLGLTVLSLLPITDSSQETRGAFVALEVPCELGQVEDMVAQGLCPTKTAKYRTSPESGNG